MSTAQLSPESKAEQPPTPHAGRQAGAPLPTLPVPLASAAAVTVVGPAHHFQLHASSLDAAAWGHQLRTLADDTESPEEAEAPPAMALSPLSPLLLAVSSTSPPSAAPRAASDGWLGSGTVGGPAVRCVPGAESSAVTLLPGELLWAVLPPSGLRRAAGRGSKAAAGWRLEQILRDRSSETTMAVQAAWAARRRCTLQCAQGIVAKQTRPARTKSSVHLSSP